MASIFEKLWRLGPAAFVFKAILVAIAADALLLAFIFLRRAYRKRFFAKRDARVFEFRLQWDALVSGKIPYERWRRKAFDRRIVEALGRTRAPEGVPALAEALRDRHLEVRLAALRGLGRTACPQAGEEILAWVGEAGLQVPALPLQSALIQCCSIGSKKCP